MQNPPSPHYLALSIYVIYTPAPHKTSSGVGVLEDIQYGADRRLLWDRPSMSNRGKSKAPVATEDDCLIGVGCEVVSDWKWPLVCIKCVSGVIFTVMCAAVDAESGGSLSLEENFEINAEFDRKPVKITEKRSSMF
ncbi:hypothetical protein DNTS_032026 [Danionella cerebrum]|uniref:Uncharacterized protein n=1 Tax=Danionella cerebrum TaxID=2873325 RepID=A0A553P9F1_9TELE|nr:hypothetical protein DNTS_032026 [Danionella translucida]